jgi:hypothetical protein
MTSLEIRHRDYAAEMRKLIDDERSSDTYNAAISAHRIVEELMSGDRELLYGWLEAHAVPTVRAAFTAADAATRSYARQNRSASVFKEAAEEAGRGNSAPLRQGFLQAVYTINDANDRKALKDMTASDILFVADQYEGRANAAKLEAAFLRAVAKKLGTGRVADKFNNVQLDELRTRIIGK